MTPHIEAGKGDYAETVLLPGDPQRAEWMAKTFLEAPRCVNRRRGALGFTGLYRGRPISIQATGIGVSSFLIYTHELLDYYGIRTLIRTGTCGGLSAEVKLRSLVISQSARPENKESGQVFGLYDADAGPDPALLARALAKAAELGIDHHGCEIGYLAIDLDGFVIQLRDEFRRRQVLAVGDFVQQGPERCLELDAGRMSINADRPVDLAIAFRILCGKHSAHGSTI